MSQVALSVLLAWFASQAIGRVELVFNVAAVACGDFSCIFLILFFKYVFFPRASERRVFQKEGGVNRSTYKRSSHM